MKNFMLKNDRQQNQRICKQKSKWKNEIKKKYRYLS